MGFRDRCRAASRIVWPFAAIGLIALPAPALGAVVAMEDGQGVVFRASSGEINDVSVLDVEGARPSIVDLGAPLVAGVGCQAGDPTICEHAPVVVHLGNRDDRVVTRSASSLRTVHGEGGDDLIRADGETAYAHGGLGEDDIAVSANVAYAFGGPGGDVITGNAGLYNDLRGERGDDRLSQGMSANCARLDGGPGSDRIVGRETNCNGPVVPTQVGGSGDDTMRFAEPARGWTEGWALEGGRGDDRISGAAGADSFESGPGWDLVRATGDGAADAVSCGPGYDRVIADPLDSVAENCEQVTITAR